MWWSKRFSVIFLVSYFLVCARTQAAELKKETLDKWDDYILESNSNIQNRLRPDGQFLWVDELPERSREVRDGKILVSPVGPHIPKPVASGLIHDWIGASFIAGAKLEDVFNVVRDYDDYKNFYTPNIVDSKSLDTDGTVNKFTLLLVNKEAHAKSLEGEYEACYLQLREKQWYGIAYSTRVQEIHNYGHPNETRLPPGEGTGYLWRIYSVARFEERDGGVYMELEAIALSRDIPAAIRWMVDPIVRRISKNALLTSLRQTSEAVRLKKGFANPPRVGRMSVETARCIVKTDEMGSPPNSASGNPER